jgi:hypothetical protein
MNKIVCLIILCLSFCLSQEERGKNMKVMMKWKLIEYLDLDESQAEKFFPKMNAHEKELKSINKEIKELKNKLEAQISSNSSSKIKTEIDQQKKEELEKNKIKVKMIRENKANHKKDIQVQKNIELENKLQYDQQQKIENDKLLKEIDDIKNNYNKHKTTY